MLRVMFFAVIIFSFIAGANSQISQPTQPERGPGGMDYSHREVSFQDFAQEPDGFWLFEPQEPKPDSAHVVVFVHGYGGYNPMIYGKWIKHLVRKGNIVIFPRYQRDMLSPHPDKFAANVVKAVNDALEELKKDGHVRPIISQMAFVGHSYGGVVSSNLAVNFEKFQIPKPKAVMLCSPGTGKFKGGRLESYADMPEDVLLLIIVSENDWVVGDEFAIKVFKEAKNVKRRNLLRQFPDLHGTPALEAHHNQTYCVDLEFDSGVRNFTSKKALRISTEDAVDYLGYWKLFDALLECSRSGGFCDVAFGKTPEQSTLGIWSDGTPVKPLEVTLPDDEARPFSKQDP